MTANPPPSDAAVMSAEEILTKIWEDIEKENPAVSFYTMANYIRERDAALVAPYVEALKKAEVERDSYHSIACERGYQLLQTHKALNADAQKGVDHE